MKHDILHLNVTEITLIWVNNDITMSTDQSKARVLVVLSNMCLTGLIHAENKTVLKYLFEAAEVSTVSYQLCV